MLRLEILEAPPDGTRTGDRFVVGPSGASLGRTDQCDWQLLDPEKVISRVHLRIVFERGRYQLQDQSTNGSFVNDSEQPVGRGNLAPLSDGDRIRVGAYLIGVSTQDAAPAASADLGSAPGVIAAPPAAPPLSPPTPAPEPPTVDRAFEGIEAVPLTADLLGGPPVQHPASQAPSPLFDGGTQPGLGVPVSNRHATDDLLGPAQPGLGVSAGIDRGAGHSAASIPNAPLQSSAAPSGSSGASAPIPDDWFLGDDDLLGVEPPAEAPPSPMPPMSPMSPMTPAAPAAPAAPPPAPSLAPPALPLSESAPLAVPQPEPMISPPSLGVAPEPPPSATSPERSAVDPAPAHRAPGSQALGDALRAVLQRVVGDAASSAGDQELLQWVTEAVELLAIATPQLVAALRSRTQFKESLRLRQTLIRAVENNPLKMPDAENNALARIILNRDPGMLQGRAAVDEAFRELAHHQSGLLAAMGPALLSTLQSISPDVVEKESGDRLPLPGRKGKLWELYCQRYASLMQSDGSDAERRFLLELADHYMMAIENVSEARTRSAPPLPSDRSR